MVFVLQVEVSVGIDGDVLMFAADDVVHALFADDLYFSLESL